MVKPVNQSKYVYFIEFGRNCRFAALIFRKNSFRFWHQRQTVMIILTTIEVLLTLLFPFAICQQAAWLAKINAFYPHSEHPYLLVRQMHPVGFIFSEAIIYSWAILTPIYLIILFIYLGIWVYRELTGEKKVA
jgi:hypothetical protein